MSAAADTTEDENGGGPRTGGMGYAGFPRAWILDSSAPLRCAQNDGGGGRNDSVGQSERLEHGLFSE